MSEPFSPSEIEQTENALEPRREPVFNLPPVVLAVIGICVAVQLIRWGLHSCSLHWSIRL